jgi:hypothetical protein
MGNPLCPYCGKIMKADFRLIESRTNPYTNKKVYGRTKFWICPNKSLLHGEVKFRIGGEVIRKK